FTKSFLPICSLALRTSCEIVSAPRTFSSRRAKPGFGSWVENTAPHRSASWSLALAAAQLPWSASCLASAISLIAAAFFGSLPPWAGGWVGWWAVGLTGIGSDGGAVLVGPPAGMTAPGWPGGPPAGTTPDGGGTFGPPAGRTSLFGGGGKVEANVMGP